MANSDDSLPLKQKVALVTGASRGIGRAIGLRLAQAGARVMLTARDAALLCGVADAVRAAGGEAATHAADLRRPEAAAEVVAATLQAFGRLDILVNNAGATRRGDFLSLTDEDWNDGFALKLHGAARLTRAAWPHLAAARGSVVFIAGVGGRTPGADFSIGGSVNAAVTALSKSLADVGVRDGVQVNTINPGFIRTDRFHARLAARAKETGGTAEAAEKRMVADARIARIGEPEDIAHLVAFLVSPGGRYLQGAAIDADGGQTKTT